MSRCFTSKGVPLPQRLFPGPSARLPHCNRFCRQQSQQGPREEQWSRERRDERSGRHSTAQRTARAKEARWHRTRSHHSSEEQRQWDSQCTQRQSLWQQSACQRRAAQYSDITPVQRRAATKEHLAHRVTHDPGTHTLCGRQAGASFCPSLYDRREQSRIKEQRNTPNEAHLTRSKAALGWKLSDRL